MAGSVAGTFVGISLSFAFPPAIGQSRYGRQRARFSGVCQRVRSVTPRGFRPSRPGVISRPLSHSTTAARLYRVLRPMRIHGGPSPVKAQRSTLRMLRCSCAARSALVRYSLRMLFPVSACSILCLQLEKAAQRHRRNHEPVFAGICF